MKKILVLGSTGSIGKAAVDIVAFDKDKFSLLGISANSNYKELAIQANYYKVPHVCIADSKYLEEFKKLLTYNPKIYYSKEGLLEFSSIKADLTINALVGFEGLMPCINAIKAGSNIALANKESLVVAGFVINKLVKEHNVYLIPIDSEHNAIYQCFEGNKDRAINKVYITASGGPFFNLSLDKFSSITPIMALSHPTWSMGKKISIDSATMANKVLEIIEAKYLFNINIDMLNILIHPQSIVHGMVEFKDASILALLSPTSMDLPIRYCLHYPNNIETEKNSFIDFNTLNSLNFFKADFLRYPILNLIESIKNNLKFYAVIFNAANEVAVNLFLEQKLSFKDIYTVINKSFNLIKEHQILDINNIIELDLETRKKVNEMILNRSYK